MDAATMQEVLKDILLLIVGALVSGIGVFYFQKRVEAKQQKTSIKFVRNHQKKLDALEDIHFKLNDFRIELRKFLNKEGSTKEDKLNSKLELASKSFSDNLIYFPLAVHIKIYDVYRILPIVFLVAIHSEKVRTIEDVIWINKGIELMNFHVLLPLDFENPDIESLHQQLDRFVEELVMRIKDIYRDIA